MEKDGDLMQMLQRIDEEHIIQAIAEKYGVQADDVCLCRDYDFVRRGDEKVRHDYIYGIVDFSNKKYFESKKQLEEGMLC